MGSYWSYISFIYLYTSFFLSGAHKELAKATSQRFKSKIWQMYSEWWEGQTANWQCVTLTQDMQRNFDKTNKAWGCKPRLPAIANEVSCDVVFLVAARACLPPSHRQHDGLGWTIFCAKTVDSTYAWCASGHVKCVDSLSFLRSLINLFQASSLKYSFIVPPNFPMFYIIFIHELLCLAGLLG